VPVSDGYQGLDANIVLMDTRPLFRDTKTGAVFRRDTSNPMEGYGGVARVKQLLNNFGETQGEKGQKRKRGE
jgi:hypothetical protein